MKNLFGIQRREIFALLGLYALLVVSYATTLAYTGLGYAGDATFGELLLEWHLRIALDYTLKLLLTVPIWWLLFRRWRAWPLRQRLWLHVPLAVVFVFGWQQLYYWASDFLSASELFAGRVSFGHLGGYAVAWDLYIPLLFYLIQFGIFHAYEYFVTARRQQAEQAQLREAALKSELAAIKAQLNPHFLYNVFNTISASVPPEQERTREMIAQLSDLFRYQLRASAAELVPLREEIAFVQKYLDLEKARYGSRLRLRIEVPEAVLDRPVPPMLLQPLVENSVRHGIAPLIEGGEIHLHVGEADGCLSFEVSDTGVGASEPLSGLFGRGIGLENTRLRLEKMFGAPLLITPNNPRGITIKFSI